jgi:hypothetical protein
VLATRRSHATAGSLSIAGAAVVQFLTSAPVYVPFKLVMQVCGRFWPRAVFVVGTPKQPLGNPGQISRSACAGRIHTIGQRRT